MITYDENANTISQFLVTYNKLKSVFSIFKQSITSDLEGNDQFGITVELETEISLTLDFIDRKFFVEFSILRNGSNSFLGKLVFSEFKNKDEDQVIIDIAYFDGNGNVKESPSARFTDITLRQPDSSIYLLKYWFVKFIEDNIEKENA